MNKLLQKYSLHYCHDKDRRHLAFPGINLYWIILGIVQELNHLSVSKSVILRKIYGSQQKAHSQGHFNAKGWLRFVPDQTQRQFATGVFCIMKLQCVNPFKLRRIRLAVARHGPLQMAITTHQRWVLPFTPNFMSSLEDHHKLYLSIFSHLYKRPLTRKLWRQDTS